MEDRLAELVKAHPAIFDDQAIFMSHLPAGWFDLVDELCNRMESTLLANERKTFRILQVKEKFGTLRFYYQGPRRLRDIVRKAEEKSGTVCAFCGAPGKVVDRDGWYIAACPDHQEKPTIR